MTERNKTGFAIIQIAFFLGLAGNLLLRQAPWGLNAFLFVTAFVAGLLLLWRKFRPELLNKTNIALASAMVFFASMFLIRDAEELLVFDTLSIIVLMGVLLLGSFDIKAPVSGVFHYIAAAIGAGLNSAFGGFLLLGADIDWKSVPGGKISGNVFAVLRGLAIALPLLLVFGALFMAADAVFEGWVNRAFNFDIDVVVSHVVVTSGLAWLTAGYFRAAIIKNAWTAGPGPASVSSQHGRKGSSDHEASTPNTNDAAAQAETRPVGSVPRSPEPTSDSYVANFTSEHAEPENALPNNASILEHINISDAPHERDAGTVTSNEAPPASESPSAPVKRDWQDLDHSKLPYVFTLGTVETVIILGLVNLLFAGFVASQIPYLFGGMELVQNTADLKLAEYARRGFGELVFVAALVLPMLLVSHWLVRRDGTRALGIYRILAGVQIALLFVIMASAVQRLLLLTGEFGYGLTTARFYPMVFMIWLAVVFSWFAVTVLVRNARNRFAWGALWAAVVILGVTNLMNPHAFIASTNLRLMQQGREFDASYNSCLSDDALPTLIRSFDTLGPDDAQTVLRNLERRSCRKLGERDFRSWNLSRSQTSELFDTYGIRPQEGDSCHGEGLEESSSVDEIEIGR